MAPLLDLSVDAQENKMKVDAKFKCVLKVSLVNLQGFYKEVKCASNTDTMEIDNVAWNNI